MFVKGISTSTDRLAQRIWSDLKMLLLSTEGSNGRRYTDHHAILDWAEKNFSNVELNTVQASVLSSDNSHCAFYGERQNGKTLAGVLFAWYYAEHGMKASFVSPNAAMTKCAYEMARDMNPSMGGWIHRAKTLKYNNYGVLKFGQPDITSSSDIVVVDEIDYIDGKANKNENAARILVIGNRKDDGILCNLVEDKLWQPYV